MSVDIEKFPAIFAHDVDPGLAKILAVSQRPLAAAAFAEAAPVAAWKTKPSWGIVSSSDHTINPDVERFGYKRAGVDAIEVDSSHLVMHQNPHAVVDIIETALAAWRSPPDPLALRFVGLDVPRSGVSRFRRRCRGPGDAEAISGHAVEPRPLGGAERDQDRAGFDELRPGGGQLLRISRADRDVERVVAAGERLVRLHVVGHDAEPGGCLHLAPDDQIGLRRVVGPPICA